MIIGAPIEGEDGQILAHGGAGLTIESPYTNFVAALRLLGSDIVAITTPDHQSTASYTLVTGTAVFTGIFIPVGTTVRGVLWGQNAAGVYTANNNNGIALWSLGSFDSHGNYTTLEAIASTGDVPTIWKGAQGIHTQDFLVPVYCEPGAYWIETLYNRSAVTTGPTIGGFLARTNANTALGDNLNSLIFSGTLSATVLPTVGSSITDISTATATTTTQWLAIY